MLRICSLLPAATEIACSIGLKDDLVAVSHECDYPLEVRLLPKLTKPVIDMGSLQAHEIDKVVADRISKGLALYDIDFGLIRELAPDLILTQDLCRVCAVSSAEIHREVRKLGLKTRVLSLDARNLRQVLESILILGEFTFKKNQAKELVQRLRTISEKMMEKTLEIENRPKVLCLDWLDPPYVAGHWVPEMVYIAGGFDGLGVPGIPSRKATLEEILDYNPEYLIVMPCGYDTGKAVIEAREFLAHPKVGDMQAIRNGNVFTVDANALFSRPGPRVFHGLQILGKILHRGLFGDLHGEESPYVAKVA